MARLTASCLALALVLCSDASAVGLPPTGQLRVLPGQRGVWFLSRDVKLRQSLAWCRRVDVVQIDNATGKATKTVLTGVFAVVQDPVCLPPRYSSLEECKPRVFVAFALRPEDV